MVNKLKDPKQSYKRNNNIHYADCPFCDFEFEYIMNKIGIKRLKLKMQSHLGDYHRMNSLSTVYGIMWGIFAGLKIYEL